MASIPAHRTNSQRPDERCNFCALSPLCLPAAFDEENLNELESIISSGKQYLPKQTVFNQGDAFHSLHVVKSGAVKTYITDTTGNECVTGFYLPGEIIGLESIAGRIHLSTAATTTDCRLCIISYENLAKLRKNNSSLSDWAVNLFSSSLASDHSFFQCLSLHSANARLATFLLDISKRSSRTAKYQLEFTLPMSRQDIGNYLGLACETTSRAFSRLINSQYIKKNSRQITILDLAKLLAQTNLCTPQS
ncbi:MAG: FNR-like transcriptional regulator [Piscirickettsiaceae bacterium]|nr:MAG: FNR-like transcriptional regulator [Piscirickettsiaceae bacterium]PCI65615.1 MAG: FNR-like transcriptional regulator [Piscirickettsiaceae bacterium]